MIYKIFLSIFLFIYLIVIAVEADNQNVVNILDEVEMSKERPIKITQENFMDIISQPEFGTLIMFYAPWCGHCKRMVNIWNQLSKKFNKLKKFYIAKVDCTEQTELCSDKDVLAYPTFQFFKNADRNGIFYDGERSLESIEIFMFSQFANENKETDIDFEIPVNELDDNNFENFISKGNHFVKFFAPWCGHCKMLSPTWEELGKKYLYSSIKISKIDCTKYGIVCQNYNIKGYPTLIFFQNGKVIDSYAGQRTIDDFSKFIDAKVQNLVNEKIDQESAYYGKVVQLTNENFKRFIDMNRYLFVKFYAPWCGHCQSMAQDWENLAISLAEKDKILIAEIDCTEYTDVCSGHGIQGYPTMYLFKNGNKLTEYSGKRDVDSFVEFLNPYLEHVDL